jgi:hypothetical protein
MVFSATFRTPAFSRAQFFAFDLLPYYSFRAPAFLASLGSAGVCSER